MRISFLKMHGLGNDFVILDWRSTVATDKPQLTSTLIRQWSARTTGIGFDQLLVIDPPATKATDADYRIFNADGATVEQCGNGVRCVAAALHAADSAETHSTWRLGSPAGLVVAKVTPDGNVAVDMGKPNFSPEALPMTMPNAANSYHFDIAGNEITASAVSVGNPHAVILVDNIDQAPVETIGPAMGLSDYFPQGVNVGFAQIIDRDTVRLRVFERGVGETRACGTGACAAMVCLRRNAQVNESVEIILPGGSLMIEWRADDKPIVMTGPASFAYEGVIAYE